MTKPDTTVVSFSFDCDLPEDYEKLPALLDSLKTYGVKGTFGIIGKWLEREPRIHQRMVDEGHEIMNHTYSHPDNEVFHPDEHFNEIPFERQREQIVKFHECAENILDVSPVGFRTPHFGDLHTPKVYTVLEDLGYLYSTSVIMTKARSHGRPYYPSKADYLREGTDNYRILEMPAAACPIHYFPAFDSVHCIRQKEPAHPGTEFSRIFAKSVDLGKRYRVPLVYDFGPQDVGGNADFDRILQSVTADKNVRTMNGAELARFAKEALQ